MNRNAMKELRAQATQKRVQAAARKRIMRENKKAGL